MNKAIRQLSYRRVFNEIVSGDSVHICAGLIKLGLMQNCRQENLQNNRMLYPELFLFEPLHDYKEEGWFYNYPERISNIQRKKIRLIILQFCIEMTK